MKLQITEAVEITARRCWTCGRWHASETYGERVGGGCPTCLEDHWRSAQNHNGELVRTIAALRGAITRLKRRVP